MIMLFLILPVISKRVCQSFRCISFDAGDEGMLKVSGWVLFCILGAV